jgi:hypothetical protein
LLKFIVMHNPYLVRFGLTILVLLMDHVFGPLTVRIWPQVDDTSTWFGVLFLAMFLGGFVAFMNMVSHERWKGAGTMAAFTATWLLALSYGPALFGAVLILGFELLIYGALIVGIAYGPWFKALLYRCYGFIESLGGRLLGPIAASDEPVIWAKFSDDSQYIRAVPINTDEVDLFTPAN